MVSLLDMPPLLSLVVTRRCKTKREVNLLPGARQTEDSKTTLSHGVMQKRWGEADERGTDRRSTEQQGGILNKPPCGRRFGCHLLNVVNRTASTLRQDVRW